MSQVYRVDLDGLVGQLDVIEGGKEVQYTMDLDPARKDCVITREVFERDKGEEAIESRSALLTLDQLRAIAPHDVEWARAPHVVWAARGMWGIPLEFGPKAETVEVVSETVSL